MTRNRILVIGAVLIVAIVIIVFTMNTMRIAQAEATYIEGIEALENGDCLTADEKLQSIADSVDNIDSIDGDEVQRILTLCRGLVNAHNDEQEGDYSQALLRYNGFITSYPDDSLADTIQAKVDNLFSVADYDEFTFGGVCNTLESEELFQGETVDFSEHEPNLTLSCAVYYDVELSAPPSAITLFTRILDQYPEHDGVAIANERLPELLHERAMRDINDNLFSSTFDEVEQLNERFPDHPLTLEINEVLPQRMIDRAREQVTGDTITDTDLSVGISVLVIFLETFPDDPRAEDAQNLLAEALILQAERDANTQTIEQPAGVPGANSGDSIVEIINATPNRLRIALVGAESRVEFIEPCASCIVYSSAPAECPSDGSETSFTLEPGTYSISVSVIDDTGVTPFSGSWILDDGFIYSRCFFIVQQ